MYLGDGKILDIARTEQNGDTTARSQFQMTSTDSGATWTRGDEMASMFETVCHHSPRSRQTTDLARMKSKRTSVCLNSAFQ